MTLDERLAQLTDKITQLTETVAAHERRWERLRRIIIAALQAGLEDDEEPPK